MLYNKVLSKVEDETDAQAAKKARAEVAEEEVELNSNFVVSDVWICRAWPN